MRIDIIISAALVSVAIIIAAFIMRPAKYTTYLPPWRAYNNGHSHYEPTTYLLDTRSGEIVNIMKDEVKRYNESVKTKTNK